MAILSRAKLIVGDAVTELSSLTAIEMTLSSNNRKQVMVLKCQKQDRKNYNEMQGQNGSQRVVILRERWRWLR